MPCKVIQLRRRLAAKVDKVVFGGPLVETM